MRSTFHTAMLLIAFVTAPGIASAGWMSEWTNVAMKPNGDRADPQRSTMAISDGKVRLEQPDAVTLINYKTETFTLMNPAHQSFWSGTAEDYARHVSKSRGEALRKRLVEAGQKSAPEVSDDVPKVDPAKLPPLSIVSTGISEKIAGYDTTKYEVKVDGDVFQELWVAPLDISSDLDINRFINLQRKMSAGMAGRSANEYNALYYSDEYRKLLAKGFVLKMIIHHLGGGFERTATSMKQADVAASEFQVPDSYRKVQLADVLPAPPPAEQPPPQQRPHLPPAQKPAPNGN